jgi:IS605 OrfB family transposase
VRGRLRPIIDPFVVAPPRGTTVRTRLPVASHDQAVLQAVGEHLAKLAAGDVAYRCSLGRISGKVNQRTQRKKALTAAASSRWAGTITRTNEDGWELGYRNLCAEQRSLRARTSRIRRRLAVPAGTRQGHTRGYPTQAERFQKQRRLQVLQARLTAVNARVQAGRVSVCRGGRRLAQIRHHLDQAGITEASWRERWAAARWFLTADGDAAYPLGNGLIAWHPDEQWLELTLPGPLTYLANRPEGRYRLSRAVVFSYRGDEVAAQAVSGAVRYDIAYDPERRRWHLSASWKLAKREVPGLDELLTGPVLATDLNGNHIDAFTLDRSGNPVGHPHTIFLKLAGLSASTRDGRLRAAISELLRLARAQHCHAIVIEDLDFTDARDQGRERRGNRPSRGRRGREFRRLLAGMPTGRFRNRLVQMATNAGLAVVAVDPAYTSRWGAEHWLDPLREQHFPMTTVHHAAAVIIGRRGLGYRARRRRGVTVDDQRIASGELPARPCSSVLAKASVLEAPRREPGSRKARGQPPSRRRKTQRADRDLPGTQVAQDRSGPPGGPGHTPAHHPVVADADVAATTLGAVVARRRRQGAVALGWEVD